MRQPENMKTNFKKFTEIQKKWIKKNRPTVAAICIADRFETKKKQQQQQQQQR